MSAAPVFRIPLHRPLGRSATGDEPILEDTNGFTDARRDAEIVAQLSASIHRRSCHLRRRQARPANPTTWAGSPVVRLASRRSSYHGSSLAGARAGGLPRSVGIRLRRRAEPRAAKSEMVAWAAPPSYRLDNGEIFTADDHQRTANVLLATSQSHTGAPSAPGVRRDLAQIDFNALAGKNPRPRLGAQFLNIFASKPEQARTYTVALIGDAGMEQITELRHQWPSPKSRNPCAAESFRCTGANHQGGASMRKYWKL